jgi:hypothetical protein
MRRMFLRFGTSIADGHFKRAHQGWIFRAPTPWILGPRPHYLVSEEQKAKIEMVLGASTFVVWLLSAVTASVVLFSMPSLLLNAPSDGTNALLIFAVCCLILIGQNLFHCFMLRVLLKGSPRTAERITFAQRLETPAAMHSVGRLRFLVMLFLAVFLVLSFFLAYQALVVGAWDLFLSLAVAASVGAAIYMGALLRVKLRSPEPISDA